MIQTKFTCFIFLVTFLYSNSLPIPPDDPTYIYLRQDFRRTHNLKLLIQPYPFSWNHLKGMRFVPSDKNGYFRFAPSLKILNNVPDFRFGIWASGNWENISFLAEPTVVHDVYGEEVLGETYTQVNVTGRFTNAYIRYKLNNIIIQFGRAPIWWGQSWESSIIQSGAAPPYDFLSAQLNFGSFQLELFSGQLHSVNIETIGRIKRFIGGKKLTYLSKSNRLLLSIGDLIIYSGVNRSMEWQYLNPIAPYFFADLEKETEYFKGVDNDNTMIFFDGRYVIKNDFSFYFEFLIDDFQKDIENRDEWPDALGWKIGIDGARSLFEREVSFEIEYTHIDFYTYITRGWYTNWEDRGIPIGYKYGPDCQSIFLMIDYWINSNYLISIRSTYLEKGALTLQSKWDPQWKVNDPFPSRPLTTYQFTTISLSWHAKYGILEAGWSNEPFPSEIAYNSPPYQGGHHEVKGGVYLKAQLVWGFGFDLE